MSKTDWTEIVQGLMEKGSSEEKVRVMCQVFQIGERRHAVRSTLKKQKAQVHVILLTMPILQQMKTKAERG